MGEEAGTEVDAEDGDGDAALLVPSVTDVYDSSDGEVEAEVRAALQDATSSDLAASGSAADVLPAVSVRASSASQFSGSSSSLVSLGGVGPSNVVAAVADALTVDLQATPPQEGSNADAPLSPAPVVSPVAVSDSITDGEGRWRASPVYGTVTVGAFSAHVCGYTRGGLRQLKAWLAAVDSGATNASPAERASVEAEVDLRSDIAFSQGLAALVTCVLSRINTILAFAPSVGEVDRLMRLFRAVGMLVQVESLLTTVGQELGMLGDLADVVGRLGVVSFVLLPRFETDLPCGVIPGDLEVCVMRPG